MLHYLMVHYFDIALFDVPLFLMLYYFNVRLFDNPFVPDALSPVTLFTVAQFNVAGFFTLY